MGDDMLDRIAIYQRRDNALTLAAMRPAIALPLIESLNDIPLIFHELDKVQGYNGELQMLHGLLEMEVERLRKAILSFGNGESFDWNILGCIDENEQLKAKVAEYERLERVKMAAEAMEASGRLGMGLPMSVVKNMIESKPSRDSQAMLQHISQPLADRLSSKPKVDVRKIRQYIQDFGDVVFPVETMEEVLELVDWQEREIERLRKEGGK
jgi:hypothetical protein